MLLNYNNIWLDHVNRDADPKTKPQNASEVGAAVDVVSNTAPLLNGTDVINNNLGSSWDLSLLLMPNPASYNFAPGFRIHG